MQDIREMDHFVNAFLIEETIEVTGEENSSKDPALSKELEECLTVTQNPEDKDTNFKQIQT